MKSFNLFPNLSCKLLTKIIFIILILYQPCELTAQEAIRVGVFQNKPLSFIDDQGKAQGIYPDVIREIAKKKKWDLEFVLDNWAGSLGRLKSGDIDLMVSIVHSKERDKIFDFSKEPVVMLWGQVYTVKDSGIVNILDLAGKNVAIMGKDINAKNFIALCQKFNIKCSFIEAKIYDDVCELILSEKADAGVINNINGEFLKRKYDIFATPIMFNPIIPVFAVPEEKNQYLLDEIDLQLSEWQKDSHSIYYSILNKWFGDVKSNLKLPYKLIATIISFAVVTSLFLLIWMRVLKRQVKSRTAELREGEEKYRLLFNSANDAVFVHQPHKDGTLVKFLEVNDVAGRMYGYTKEELLELSPTDLANPEREKEVRDQVKKLLTDGYNIFEIVHKKKGGKEFPVEVSAYLFDFKNKSTILSIVRDITERKKSEKKLYEEKEFTETALNSQQDTFFLFDSNTGKAIRWNKAFSKVSGYDDDEIAKMIAPNSYYSAEDLEKVPLFMDEVLETGRGRIELELVCKDGLKIPTEYNVSVIKDKHGNPKYIISIGRDITERKQAEDSLKSSQERFLTVLNSIDATVYVVDIETYEILFMNEYMMKSFS